MDRTERTEPRLGHQARRPAPLRPRGRARLRGHVVSSASNSTSASQLSCSDIWSCAAAPSSSSDRCPFYRSVLPVGSKQGRNRRTGRDNAPRTQVTGLDRTRRTRATTFARQGSGVQIPPPPRVNSLVSGSYPVARLTTSSPAGGVEAADVRASSSSPWARASSRFGKR